MTGPWWVWLPVIRTWRMPALSAISRRMIFIMASVGPRPRSMPTSATLSSPAAITIALAINGSSVPSAGMSWRAP